MPHPTRKAIARFAVTVLMIVVVVYPLSYAPVVKLQQRQVMRSLFQGHHGPDGMDDPGINVFGPATHRVAPYAQARELAEHGRD